MYVIISLLVYVDIGGSELKNGGEESGLLRTDTTYLGDGRGATSEGLPCNPESLECFICCFGRFSIHHLPIK